MLRNVQNKLSMKLKRLKARWNILVYDREEMRRAGNIFFFASAAAVSLIFFVINMVSRRYNQCLISGAMCLLSAVDLIMAVRNPKLLKAATTIFQIELMALMYWFVVSGSLGGFSIMWFLLVPSVCMVLYGRKQASVLSIILFLMLVFFFHVPLGRSLLQYNYSDVYRVRFPIIFLVFFILSFVLESAREDALTMLDKVRGNLEIRNRLLYKTFGKFLPDDVISGLLKAPEGESLTARSAVLTVLQSDIRGFSAIAGRMGPMNLVDMLNHYLGEMTAIVQKHNGTVIEFMGDGILAVFGAPAHDTLHAQHAVEAAVEMQLAMEGIRSWNREHCHPDFEIGIGIHSGDAVIGVIGSEKHLKYDAIGHTINVGSRVESYSTGGQVLVSDDAIDLINVPVEIEKRFQVMPKGMDRPKCLNSVTGISGMNLPEHEGRCANMRFLDSPVRVTFYRIDDKHCDMTPLNGQVVEYSIEGILLDTSEKLAMYEDIRISAGVSSVLGKVIEEAQGRYHVRFTSVPPEFEGFE